MSIQPPLFDLMPPEIPNDAVTQGAYRRTDPETSKEAAKSINAETLEKHVYDYMVRRGKPVILDDVVRDLHMDKVTASPRFAKLQKAGPKGVTLKDAVDQFLTDKRNQNVSKAWLGKFELLLEGWAPEREIVSLTLRDLEAFRDTWTGAPITKRKKQERLRSFFHYCVKHRWIPYNLAGDLSRIRVDQKPTEPLTKEAFAELLESAEGDFRALVLLMRYSGLRITDAVQMGKEKMEESTVFLRTQKTGVRVRVPIPEDVAEEIRTHLPLYRGGMTLKSRVTQFQEMFQSRGIHSHQLRDTFAVELLLVGVTIEDVAILLGHASIKVTERAYSPWVKARQDRLEASIKKSWKS
jgi:integrase/recombinase XerD